MPFNGKEVSSGVGPRSVKPEPVIYRLLLPLPEDIAKEPRKNKKKAEGKDSDY